MFFSKTISDVDEVVEEELFVFVELEGVLDGEDELLAEVEDVFELEVVVFEAVVEELDDEGTLSLVTLACCKALFNFLDFVNSMLMAVFWY